MKSEPKKYRAMTLPITDRIIEQTVFEVTGYYVKHITATPYPISTKEDREQFIAEHTVHYIVRDGFSDWALPRNMERWEIDIDTLKEVDE